MQATLELACPRCGRTESCGPTAMLDWLRSVKMIRAGSDADADVIAELFRSAAGKFTCRGCQALGLVAREPEPERDEDWGMARACQSCGRPIARERLEVFPDAVLCVACQSGEDRGQSPDQAEYCPRCGNAMRLVQSRKAGITRYVMTCPSCRR